MRLPSGWKVKKMWEVCDVRDGTHDSPKYQDNGYPLITSKNLKRDGLNFNKIKYISQTDYININKRSAVHKGDILFAMIGTIGNPIIVECETNFAIKNVALFKIPRNLSNYFLKYYFESEFVKTKMWQEAKGTTQKFVGLGYLRDFPVFLPPFPEQKRIANILDEAFAAIDKAKANAEKNLQNSRELFDSYLNNVFANPGGDWEKVKLEDVSELISKGSSPKWQGIKYVEDPGILFVTSENVGKNTMLLSKRKYVEEKFNIKEMKSILKNGDVLTNIVGASIGRTAIFDLDDVANINQAVCLIRCNQNLLFNEYLMYILNSPFIKQHLHDNEVNNARANLSLGFFRNLSIPLPKIKKQKSIVSQIKSFHIETQKLESIYQQKIDDLEELKKTILQKAFEGQL